MNENELFNKIKELKQIKPNQSWVVLTKNQILGGEPSYRGRASVALFAFDFLRKPGFAVVAAVLLLFAGLAGFFYLTERPNEMAEVPAETEQAKMIVLALEELQTEVNQATEALKKIKEPQKVLEARNVVIPTIEAVRNVIAEAPAEAQVLAMKINKMESALDEMTAIQAKSLIQDLETRTLTDIQNNILEKAKQAYEQGNYTEALINGLFVSQLIQ